MSVTLVPDQYGRLNGERIHFDINGFSGYIRASNISVWFDTGARRSILVVSDQKFTRLMDFIQQNNIVHEEYTSNLLVYGVIVTGDLKFVVKPHGRLRLRTIYRNDVEFIMTTASQMRTSNPV